jgi:hypothetical protein
MEKPRPRRHDAGAFGRLTGWDRYVIGDTYSAANEGLKEPAHPRDRPRSRGERDFFTLLDIVINDDLQTVLCPVPPTTTANRGA